MARVLGYGGAKIAPKSPDKMPPEEKNAKFHEFGAFSGCIFSPLDFNHLVQRIQAD